MLENTTRKLSREEGIDRATFMKRLNAADRENVGKVIRFADSLARLSFTKGIIDTYPEYEKRTLADLNAWAYSREPDEDIRVIDYTDTESGVAVIRLMQNEPIIGTPFIAVYAIGGNVTKEGDRNDIDLMVVTNTGFPVSLNDFRHSHVVGYNPLRPLFLDSRIQGLKTLPDNYNIGETKGKSMVRIRPSNSRSIDIVFVTSMHSSPGSPADILKPSILTGEIQDPHVFLSRKDFETRLDVDEAGAQLPRTLLYCATQNTTDPYFSNY